MKSTELYMGDRREEEKSMALHKPKPYIQTYQRGFSEVISWLGLAWLLLEQAH